MGRRPRHNSGRHRGVGVRPSLVEAASLHYGLVAGELREGSGGLGVQIELRPSAAVSTHRLRVWAADRTLRAHVGHRNDQWANDRKVLLFIHRDRGRSSFPGAAGRLTISRNHLLELRF